MPTLAPASVSVLEARQLFADSVVVDGLSGHIVSPEPAPVDGVDYLTRLRGSGIDAVNITLAAHADDLDEVLHEMYAYFNLIAARPESVIHVKTVEDIHEAHESGRVGIIFGSQTGTIVGTDISRWTILHQLGLRICQIAYNERNVLGDGCFEPENRGLTAFGRQAVNEMNRLGICVDLSHTGERTTLEASELSAKPVVYSHSNPKALCEGRRNITDEQMAAMARTGGLMGLSSHSIMTYREPGVRPTRSDYLDMFDYAIDKVGIDHVAIGSDIYESYTKLSWESSTKRMYPTPFFFETMYAEGGSKVTDLIGVAEGLAERGYGDDDIRKVVGGNWLRVFEAVWSVG